MVEILQAGISPFFSTNWKPAEYRQLQKENHKIELADNGYFVCEKFFSGETIEKLNALYQQHQHVGVNNIGMFMSAYSKDLDYRKSVHEAIDRIVKPELGMLFQNYQPAVYNFVIKTSMPGHELPMHQDITLIDETKSSPINIWIALEDVNIENGPVCVVPKTQYFFPPWRSNFSEQNISDLSKDLKQYAVPVCMKAGDILVFDSRLLHYSMPNVSGKDRIGAVTYIFPDDVPFMFMSKSKAGGECDFDLMELKREDFFINTDFEKAEQSGLSGKVVANVEVIPFTVTGEQVHTYFNAAGIKPARQVISKQTQASLLKRIFNKVFS
jgi:hypothetical protein